MYFQLKWALGQRWTEDVPHGRPHGSGWIMTNKSAQSELSFQKGCAIVISGSSRFYLTVGGLNGWVHGIDWTFIYIITYRFIHCSVRLAKMLRYCTKSMVFSVD